MYLRISIFAIGSFPNARISEGETKMRVRTKRVRIPSLVRHCQTLRHQRHGYRVWRYTKRPIAPTHSPLTAAFSVVFVGLLSWMVMGWSYSDVAPTSVNAGGVRTVAGPERLAAPIGPLNVGRLIDTSRPERTGKRGFDSRPTASFAYLDNRDAWKSGETYQSNKQRSLVAR